jgi:hypothetical protein
MHCLGMEWAAGRGVLGFSTPPTESWGDSGERAESRFWLGAIWAGQRRPENDDCDSDSFFLTQKNSGRQTGASW